jgi:hypothetical protein
MGLFSDDKKSDDGDSLKRAKQRKEAAKIDQEIAELQMKKAKVKGESGGGDDFWSTWWNTDLDW